MIKFTSYLPTVGGSLRVLQLLPPLKLVGNIAESGIKHNKSNQSSFLSSVLLYHCPFSFDHYISGHKDLKLVLKFVADGTFQC